MPISQHTKIAIKLSEDLRLRPATLADASLVAQMHVQSWVTAYRGILPDAFLDHELPAERAAHWAHRMTEIEAGAGEVLIAEAGETPIGFVCVANPDDSGSVLVDNLHALPGYKGAGAGSAMLRAAKAWARERGARQLHLYVLEANRAAIGFYESRGWQLAGREDDHMGGIDLIALRYTLALD